MDKLVIVQVGSDNSGGITAYDLEKGEAKWKWTDEGAAYASPVLMTVDNSKMVVAETSGSVVGLDLSGGKTKWKTPFPLAKGGYNASTPMVDGATVIFSGSGRGTWAFKVEKSGDSFALKEQWNNKETSVIFNTPVLKNGLLYGLTSADSLFCLNAETSKTAWTHEIGGAGRYRGYGSVVDAGPVLLALNPTSKLYVFEPSDKEYKQLAKYKVANSEVFAYPVVTGNRIYIKDKDSVILWTVDEK